MGNLEVPYISQWDSVANASNNLCGPTSCAMVINFFGGNVTPNQVFQYTGAGQGLITIGQLQQAITALGYHSEYKTGLTLKDIQDLIAQNIAPIALLHYGSLQTSRQDTHYQGGHFVVIDSCRDDGYIVNDPDFSGEFRQDGDHHFYLKAEFEAAWGNCNLDENPNNSLLIIYPKSQPTTNCLIPNTPEWQAKYQEIVGKASKYDEFVNAGYSDIGIIEGIS